MRVLITSLNRTLGLNPIVQRLFSPLPWVESSPVDRCEAVFLSFIAESSQFDLDAALLEKIVSRRVPVVVFDHVETFPPAALLGIANQSTDQTYAPLFEAATRFDIRAYFKREMPAVWVPSTPFPVYPLDWTVPEYPHGEVDTREQFDSRPIDVLMSWGYSSESRPRLYGELMRQAGRFAAHFCLQSEDVSRALAAKHERLFALLFAPHYRRIPLPEILAFQKQAKVSISLKGMGLKCFRCAEASYNSLLAQQTPEAVQWSYPWVAGVNCIGLPNGQDGEIDSEAAVETLWRCLRVNQGSLYDIYLKCIENQRNYHMANYSKNYLMPKLLKALR